MNGKRAAMLSVFACPAVMAILDVTGSQGLMVFALGFVCLFVSSAMWALVAWRRWASYEKVGMWWIALVAVWGSIISIAVGRPGLRLAFLACRPTLERLADRVDAGLPVGPRWVGPFRIVAGERRYGAVTILVTNPEPSGPTGFVRSRTTPGAVFEKVRLDPNWLLYTED